MDYNVIKGLNAKSQGALAILRQELSKALGVGNYERKLKISVQ